MRHFVGVGRIARTEIWDQWTVLVEDWFWAFWKAVSLRKIKAIYKDDSVALRLCKILSISNDGTSVIGHPPVSGTWRGEDFGACLSDHTWHQTRGRCLMIIWNENAIFILNQTSNRIHHTSPCPWHPSFKHRVFNKRKCRHEEHTKQKWKKVKQNRRRREQSNKINDEEINR